MSHLSIQPAASSSMLPVTLPPRDFPVLRADGGRSAKVDQQAELREQFTQFVGETFYGQMIKAMRSTVGKPAYFHGGRGEEVFRGQLDQKLAEHMTEATAERFADPLFHRQFPHLSMK
ncbi:MAG: rod-binding protein [Pirellulales bacterium]